MKKALILFLLALLPVLIFADTDIYPGNVSGKWMLRDSPFIIHGDINIINTDSLIIDQGVEVKFAGHYQIECHGFIETNGTPSNHVTFTVTDTTGFSDYSISNGSWRGIYFDYTTSTSKFNYTTIKYTKDLGTNTRYGTLLGDGGAICLAGSDIQIRNCEFAYNYAIHYGGAIYVESSNGFLVENTSFYNNFSDANAAAIYSNSSSVQILTNRFFDNKSALKGGALAIVNSSTGNISGNLFHHNHADIGGALYFDNATCDFYNNTVANNIADTSAGGLAIDNGVSLDFINNIVYFNSLHQIQFASTPGFYTNYSDIQDASSEYWFATGCLDVDPLFLNPPNNYALNDTSLCINAGDPASDTYDSVPSHDLNGASRFNGAAIDMGAYEANGGSVSDFMANFHADKTEIYKGSDIQFYDDSSEATSWSWDFGDGSTSNEKNPLHTYMESGNFTVSLTAAGAGGNGSETKVNYITVRNGTYITDTDVSGFWGANNSPYIIATDIEIGEGQQLIIQQGSQVLFEDNYSMSVYGTLLAQGAINDSIYFAVTDTTGYSSNNHTGWSGIEFIDLANTTPPASQLSHCVLAYAKNSDNGGALYFDNTFDFVTVEHSRIVRCRANNGGAIALDNSSYPTFTDLYLIENKAENMGGAIYANNLSDFHYNIGKISRNTAMSASAIYATGNSQFELNNILISKNNAQNGATIDLSQIGDINFRNLTIADNHTGNIGYAISTINTNLAIKNSILWNPSLTREINADDENSATLYFSDIKDGWATGTNIYSIPPNFKNNVKYRLSIMNQDGSDKNPLIDAGDPASDFSQEPMPNGGRINLGAWGGTSRAEYSCSVVLDNITDNTVWNRTELYVVNRNVTVQEAATLNIEAGTVIQASGNHSIHILGRIVAQGTRGDTIRFTNNYDESGEDTPWNGIILESTNAQECILQNVVIENATNGLSIIDKAIHLSGTNIEFSLYSQIPTRGFSASGASDVNLSDCNITGFSTGVKFNNNRRDTATPTLTNTRIRNSASSSRDDDTAVDINGNVAVTIDNCTIEDYSTGISQDGQAGQTASPTITNSRIRNSTSSSRTLVTAIQLDDIANPMIDNNIIEGYTNAIKIVTTRRDESTPTIQNTRLRNSPSSSRNNTTCGIYLNGNVIADMINNEIDDFDTGIKYIGTGTATRDTPTLTNNRIRNSTSSSRDSLLATGIELSNVINITVDADSVLDYPVGIDISNTSRGTSTPTLTNTRVRNSTSSSRDISYGIKIIGSVAASVTNLDIDYYDYGVHYIGTGGNLRTTPTLTNTRIRNSTSSSRTAGRAGIYYEDVISSTIDGCNISEYPLAINMLNNRRDTATPTLTNSRIRTSPSSSRTLSKGIVLNGAFTGEISNNEIVNQDSAIVLYGAEANPLIKQNSIYFDEMEDDDEGAVAVYSQNSSDLLLTNNTIYLYDYALVTDSANVQLTNIISYKRNPQYEPIPESAGITVTYSDIARPNDAIYPGTGNINEDPLFYNAIQGDFSLKTDSRCIDAGDPTENDPDGSRTDIGRYFRPSLKNFDSQFTFGALPSHNVQFSQTSTGFNDTNTTWYWDVDNDGTYDVQGKNPTYQYSQAGVYSVKLKVVKNTVQDSLIKENFVVIQSNQLPAPQNLQLSVTGSDITLTWDPIQWTRRDRGRYYLIYKSDRPDANFEYLDRTNNVAEYIHTDGATLKKAFYKIIAFSGDFRSLILYIENHREVNNSTRDVKRTK